MISTKGRYSIRILLDLAEHRNRHIGFIFQFHHLLPEFSALENVMMPAVYAHPALSMKAMRERSVELLNLVGLSDRMDHTPAQLSGGQQQRVAIARSLINNPSILLADEPTGNLDSATGALVMETFHKLQKRGKTIVLITHDPGIAAEADRAVTIRDGRIHDGAYIPHAPRTLRSAVDSLPIISASANPPKGVVA